MFTQNDHSVFSQLREQKEIVEKQPRSKVTSLFSLSSSFFFSVDVGFHVEMSLVNMTNNKSILSDFFLLLFTLIHSFTILCYHCSKQDAVHLQYSRYTPNRFCQVVRFKLPCPRCRTAPGFGLESTNEQQLLSTHRKYCIAHQTNWCWTFLYDWTYYISVVTPLVYIVFVCIQ